MPSGADRCLATEPSRSTTHWCGTLNRDLELQRRPITLTARVHNALDKPRSFTDAALLQSSFCHPGPMTNLPDEADAILALLRADLLASVGLPLEAVVRLISPEEQRARDLELDARFSD